MMTTVDIIYRYCEEDHKTNTRPTGFTKTKAYANTILNLSYSSKRNNVDINTTVVFDGPRTDESFFINKYSKDTNTVFDYISENSNEGSYKYVLNLARKSTADIIYLLEDDYWHIDDAMYYLLAGVKKFGVITGYYHPDRLTRNDDITFGQEFIGATNRCIWTTNESTTCTYMFTKEYKDIILGAAETYLLHDREMWRSLIKNVRLWAPTLSISTHCDKRFMAPFINWHELINYS